MSKTALVLGGGGAKGSYQVGVLEALKNLKVKYDIVTGASVGSINGAIAVLGNISTARKLWKTLTVKNVLDLSEEDTRVDIKRIIEKGGYSYGNLKSLLEKYIDEDDIRNSPIDYGLVTVKYPDMMPVYKFKEDIENGHLTDYILGSSAFFPAMRPFEILGNLYIDGGFSDNLPINMAIEKGADRVIAVDLKAIGLIKKARNKDINIIRISPSRDLGEVLAFDPKRAKINMKLGYLDTLKVFKEADGYYYTFKNKDISAFIKKSNLNSMINKLLKSLPKAYRTAFLKSLELVYRTETGKTDTPSTRDYLVYILEYLMSLCNLPCYEIYSLKKANILINKSFKTVETESFYLVKENLLKLNLKGSLQSLVKNANDIIKTADKKTLIKLIYENFDSMKNKSSLILIILAIVAPKELLSALYLKYFV